MPSRCVTIRRLIASACWERSSSWRETLGESSLSPVITVMCGIDLMPDSALAMLVLVGGMDLWNRSLHRPSLFILRLSN